MALIFLDKSTCGLCGKLFASTDKNIVGLPAISDVSHELYVYFDQGFHFKCYDNWDKKEAIEEVIREEKIKFHKSGYAKSTLRQSKRP